MSFERQYKIADYLIYGFTTEYTKRLKASRACSYMFIHVYMCSIIIKTVETMNFRCLLWYECLHKIHTYKINENMQRSNGDDDFILSLPMIVEK